MNLVPSSPPRPYLVRTNGEVGSSTSSQTSPFRGCLERTNTRLHGRTKKHATSSTPTQLAQCLVDGRTPRNEYRRKDPSDV
jgi:hypothetical protein